MTIENMPTVTTAKKPRGRPPRTDEVATLYVEIPVALKAQMIASARAHCRSLTGESVVALRRWIADGAGDGAET